MLNIEVAQPGLFDESSRHGRLLEYSLLASENGVGDMKTAVRSLLQYVDGIEGLYLNLAFGSRCWDLLNAAWRPEELVPFTTLATAQLTMPASQGDIFIWLHSADVELIPQAVINIYQVMRSVALLQLDIEGIKNKQSRDLIGFVDGTANAKDDQRLPVALIPAGKAGAGGSYVISQRWQHDLEKFNGLAITEQEKVVGRTKEEDVELEGDDMPENSHVSRTDAKVGGIGMKIYRRSYPYMASQMTATSHGRNKKPDNGLYFLAFACEMQRFTVQLNRMMGLTPDGINDKLMQFSQVKNSSYWFMPNANDLNALFK
jgi:putative iron-dependent peroxidase